MWKERKKEKKNWLWGVILCREVENEHDIESRRLVSDKAF